MEFPRTTLGTLGRWVGLALLFGAGACGAATEPAAVRSPDWVAGKLVHEGPNWALAGPGTIGFGFECTSEARLSFEVRAEGAGTVEARLVERNPEHGRERAQAFEPLRLEPAAGETKGGFPLRPTRRDVLELQLEWKPSSPTGELGVVRLVVEESAPKARPSILFLSVDTLAAKHLSLYGYPRRTSPTLDELAQNAIVFEHCLANAAATGPSYVSQFTGLYPRASQARHTTESAARMNLEAFRIQDGRWTLTEMLRARGYATGGFVDNAYASQVVGLDQGFDHFDVSAVNIPKKDPEGGIRTIRLLAQDWVGEQVAAERPFFAFLNVLDPHAPYVPPPEVRGRFVDDDHVDREHVLPTGRGIYTEGAIVPHVAEGLELAEVPAQLHTAPLIDRYDQLVSAVDDELAKLLAFIRELGIYDELLVIISADHGETMADGPLAFMHGVPAESVLHVPLILRFPQGEWGPQRIASTVQLVDLAPTLAEVLGIGGERDHWHGHSLLGRIRGEEPPGRPVFHEGGHFRLSALTMDGWRLVEVIPYQGRSLEIFGNRHGRQWLWSRFPAAQGLRLGIDDASSFLASIEDLPSLLAEARAALSKPHFELYHVASDPHLENDRAAEEPGRVASMQALLERERARSRAAYDELEAEVIDWSGEALENLEALGYVEAR